MDANTQYMRGFNNAYLLAKHEPVLLSKLIPALAATNDYFQGFFSGKEQCELEYAKEKMIGLDLLRKNSRGRGRELDRER